MKAEEYTPSAPEPQVRITLSRSEAHDLYRALKSQSDVWTIAADMIRKLQELRIY
jgi:hypothetical protein